MFLKDVYIFLAGLFAGFINTIAGGGSLLTLPVLIFAGLPSSVANGTNRIALVMSTGTASARFYKKGYIKTKTYFWLAIPAVVGSFIGANLAISMSDRIFHFVLAVIMVIAVIFVVWKPKRKIDTEAFRESWTKKQVGMTAGAFFLIGIYGGFIQAGVAFVILTILSGFLRFPLIVSNSYKNAVICLYIFCSLFVFIFHHEVNWELGIVLAVGNMFGAWVGSHVALTKGDKWIRVFLVLAVVVMAVKLIFFS